MPSYCSFSVIQVSKSSEFPNGFKKRHYSDPRHTVKLLQPLQTALLAYCEDSGFKKSVNNLFSNQCIREFVHLMRVTLLYRWTHNLIYLWVHLILHDPVCSVPPSVAHIRYTFDTFIHLCKTVDVSRCCLKENGG